MTYLEQLEAESIHLLREVIATTARPIMLCVHDLGSAVLLHLLRKAFHPAVPPLTVLDGGTHDTQHDCLCTQIASKWGLEPVSARTAMPPRTDDSYGDYPHHHAALASVLDRQRCDAVLSSQSGAEIGAAVVLVASGSQQHPRPAPWQLQNTCRGIAERLWVFPLAQWSAEDLAQYLQEQNSAWRDRHPVLAAAREEPQRAAAATAPFRPLLRFVVCGDSTARAALIEHLASATRSSTETSRGAPPGQSTGSALIHWRFNTARRAFLAVTSHEPRALIAGATTATLAVLALDARHGVPVATRKYGYLAHLLGVRHFVLAVTQLDQVNDEQAVFERIVAEYRAWATRNGIAELTAIPLVGPPGDVQFTPPWYTGPSLLDQLETAPLAETLAAARPLCLPVQWVHRSPDGVAHYAGSLVGGTAHPGDRVRVLPGGKTTTISRVLTAAGESAEAHAGQAVLLTLRDESDGARGQCIVAADRPLEVADQFEITLIWLADEPLLPGRSYLLQCATNLVDVTVTRVKYRIDAATLAHEPGLPLGRHDIGVCNIATDRPLPFAPHAEQPALGGVILIDRQHHGTVGVGMIHFALRRSHNIHWQNLDVDRAARAALKNQQPRVLWFTGLSGSGKSTLANLVEKQLHARGRHTFILDGDNIRHGLNRDLGFTEADRVENIRRIGEVAKLMADAGLIVLTAFISPFRSERDMVRRLLPAGEFIEIFVDVPLAVAEARDPKGLYRKARAGILANFTGIDSPYEPPLNPELHIDTARLTAEEGAAVIVDYLECSLAASQHNNRQ